MRMLRPLLVVLTMMAFPATAAPLVIHADGEEGLLNRLARAFEERHPGTTVELRLMRASLAARSVLTAPVSGAGPDLVISGATDHQVKLVNDGYAMAHRSDATAALPPWAQWRGELFGITREESLIAVSPALTPPPRSRGELLALIDGDPARFARRIHTLHVGLDGTAYAFATFDSQTSPAFWRLLHAIGGTAPRLSGSPAELLERLAREEGVIAWPLAGSQSVLDQARALGLTLIAPEDFRITVLRTALIPKSARNPTEARRFLDFLLSPEGQSLIGETALLPAAAPPEALLPLGPESLVFRDEMKRLRFLDNWLDLLIR